MNGPADPAGDFGDHRGPGSEGARRVLLAVARAAGNHLGGPRQGHPPEDGWAQIRPVEGTGEPTLNFEYEEQWKEPVWPAEVDGQNATQHLDIQVSDLQAAITHALHTGASLAEFQPQETWRVLFDPAGHPLCLFT